MSKHGPLKRGNRRGKKLFWAYYTSGKEMWVSEKKFDAAMLAIKLSDLESSLSKMEEKLKKKRILSERIRKKIGK